MAENKVPLTTSHEKEAYRNSYSVVTAAFLVTMAGGMAIFSFGIFLKPISASFGWTRTEISGAFSVAMILSGLLGILTGRLGDRFKPTLIIIICGAIQGSAYVLLSQLTALWQLYACFGLMVGIGVANAIPVISLVTRSYTRTRGTMMGITLAGGGVGAVVASPVATHFIASNGWQSSYLIMGSIMLSLIAISAVFLYWPGASREIKNESKPSIEKTNTIRKELNLREALCSIQFWTLGAIIFCTGLIQMIITVHIVPGAMDTGISATGAAGILSVVNFASIAGSSSSGTILDRIGSWLSVVIALFLMLIGLFVLLSLKDIWAFYVFAIIYGFGWGIVVTSRGLITADLFGLRSYGVIVGIILFLYTLGGTLGPVIAGYIFDVSQHYQIAFILITGLCALSIAMAFTLRGKLRGSDNK
jgi:MFS family permease